MAKKKAILWKIDGQLRDIGTGHAVNDPVEEVYVDAAEALDVFRHSAAHLLAQAVTELYPHVQYGIGPAVEDGFYYDFLVDKPFTPEDLDKISVRMAEIAKADVAIEHLNWSKADAGDYFAKKGQSLKQELLQEKVVGNEVSLYRQGDFVDMCRGPHLPSTGFLRHFKLMSVAAAYWKGDERNHSLQRIYGVAFSSAEELGEHLRFLQEAQERDHRRLGRTLDLFSLQEESGPGLVYWHPKGARIRYLIEEHWKKRHYQEGYDLLYTPHIGREWLWQTSGHLQFYKDAMYAPMDIDGQNYYLKPMNCPFHIMIYKSALRSYRDLPLRWAELGTVYRYERSGVLHGLLRVRGFTQDDAHIICTPEQIDDEILRVLDFSLDLLRSFGFNDFCIELAVRDPRNPEKYVGSDERWCQAEASLVKALNVRQLEYKRMEGEAVFYGPKIDIKIRDALKRTWQCTTIQFDFNMSERFQMEFIAADGTAHRPYMVHRALLGSLERFFGVLIEHYGGFFPVWLAPVQVKVIPVTERNLEYARQVSAAMIGAGIRVEVEVRNEAIGKKIRAAEVEKIPYIVILGDKEQQAGDISLRLHKKGDCGRMALASFMQRIKEISEGKLLKHEI